MQNQSDTTTSVANDASAGLEASNEDARAAVEINGVLCKPVSAYTTKSGKVIPAHYRPIRCCRSYAQQPSAKPVKQAPRVSVAQAIADADVAIGAAIVTEAPPCQSLAIAASSNGFDARTFAAPALDNVPVYIAENGEVQKVERGLKAKHNILLTGPTQCGKTNLVHWLAKQQGAELFTVQGGAGANYDRIIATKDLTAPQGATVTKLNLGILPNAMLRGAEIYVDEPNGIPNDVLFYLFSAMDWRREITLENGEVIRAKDGFRVLCAMNEGAGYAGTTLLNNAFRARCKTIVDMHYLPEHREAKLVSDRTGCKLDVADKLAKAATQLRQALLTKTIRTPIGTSALLGCAEHIVLGAPINEALEVAIINQVPSTMAPERKAISDVLAAYFGKAVK